MHSPHITWTYSFKTLLKLFKTLCPQDTSQDTLSRRQNMRYLDRVSWQHLWGILENRLEKHRSIFKTVLQDTLSRRSIKIHFQDGSSRRICLLKNNRCLDRIFVVLNTSHVSWGIFWTSWKVESMSWKICKCLENYISVLIEFCCLEHKSSLLRNISNVLKSWEYVLKHM